MTQQLTTQGASLSGMTGAGAVVDLFAASQDVKEASRKIYKSNLLQFFRWVNETGRSVETLALPDLIKYKEYLLELGRSTLTIASAVNSVRRFYEWTEANKIYPNIGRGVHAPKRTNDEFRHKPLSVAKVGDLLKYERKRGNSRDYAIISLMLYTGLRCVEVARANIGDITYIGENNERVLMVQGKGRESKDNFVLLRDAVYQPIKEYLSLRKGARNDEPLFIAASNNNKGGRMTTRAISAICKRGLQAIGLDSHLFTAHSLRHTAGTNILRAGGSLEQAQMTLRHSNPATTEIYIKMALKERRLTDGGEILLEKLYSKAQKGK